MITFILIFFATICGIGLYIHGYEQGFIDGKLDEKWRMKSVRKISNIKRT